MNRFCTTLIALLASLIIALPAGAQGTSKTKPSYSKKYDIHYRHYHFKHEWQKIKALKQFRELKQTYSKSMDEAKQMFLEYLGSALPTTDADIQKIREEYEQQIAQLNGTITSQQEQLTQANATIAAQTQQITQLNATIASLEQQAAQLSATNASQAAELTLANATIASQTLQLSQLNGTIASQQQQISDLNATISSQQTQITALVESHAQDLTDLRTELTQLCDAQLGTEYQNGYDNGMADGIASCPTTQPAGPPQEVGSWSTGSLYPYALDVDGSGNTYVLDQDYRTVAVYDGSGALTSQWTSNTFSMPSDLALDSQNNVYILDAYASAPLQKFSPAGQSMAFGQGSSPLFYPTGLFIDSQDNVYVTDLGGNFGHRILVFDSAGNQVNTLADGDILPWEEYRDIAVDEQNHVIYLVTGDSVARFDMAGTLLNSWSGSFRSPSSVAIGSQGQVFVTDTYNNEIDQYDVDGNLIYSFNSNGALYRPVRIVVDGLGRLCLADERNMMVRLYQ